MPNYCPDCNIYFNEPHACAQIGHNADGCLTASEVHIRRALPNVKDETLREELSAKFQMVKRQTYDRGYEAAVRDIVAWLNGCVSNLPLKEVSALIKHRFGEKS